MIHNGVKYELLQGGTLVAGNEHRTGSWQRNNLTLPDIAAAFFSAGSFRVNGKTYRGVAGTAYIYG